MPSAAESSTRALTPSGRISYARIDKKVDGVSYEKFEIPNLIELQLDSFAWFVDEGSAGAVRRDQPDQGLHRQGDGAPVPRLRVRRAQVLRGGVPDQGPDVQQAALRQRRAPDQGDRRDPAPARLHGRLPVDDRPGHVRHQRRGARRRQPARPLAGRLLQRARGPGVRPDALLGQGHPEPRRLARVRDQQQGPAVGQGRPQAQDRGDDPAARGRVRAERRDRRPVRHGRHRSRSTRTSPTRSTRT